MSLSTKKFLVVVFVFVFIVFGRLYWSGWNHWRSLNASNVSQIEEVYIVLPDRGPNLTRLPNLTAIEWLHHNRPNYTRRTTGTGFDIKLGPGQHESFEILLKQFEQIMIGLKLHDQWFLCAGSLIGSLRHHEITPWDDDVDVCLNVEHRQTVQNALRELPEKFQVYSNAGRDKLFFKPISENEIVDSSMIGSYQLPKYPWSWPFLDIFYLKKIGATTAVELMWESVQTDLLNIYPVVYRPFGRNWYPSPRYPVSFLRAYYRANANRCVSSYYSHAKEVPTSYETVECSSLADKHAFVHRCPDPLNDATSNGLQICDEYLVGPHGSIIHSVKVLMESKEIGTFNFALKHPEFACP